MSRRYLLLAVLTCGATATAAAQSARVDSLLAASAWREAVVLLDSQIVHAPTAQDLARRGRAWRELNDLPRSRADYDAAITIDSLFGAAYAGRAATRIRMSDGAGGLADVTRARTLGVAVPALWLLEGLANGLLDREAAAITALTRYVEAEPGDPVGWYYRGYTHGRAGRHVQAIDDLTRAIARGFAGPEAHRFRGISHGTLGNSAQACADGREAAARGDAAAAERVAQSCS